MKRNSLKKIVTKKQLIALVAEDFECTLPDAKEIVNLVFGKIIEEVDKGRIVELRGFGTFSASLIKPTRKYIAPYKKIVKLKPKLRATFKPSITFTKSING